MRRCLLLLASLLGVSVAQQCFDSGDKLINKKCFKLVNQKLSFNDARNWCHYSNPITPSYLATVDDQTTSTFLASYARTAFNTNEGKFWIGLSRNSTNSPLYWDDGTRFGWDNFDFKDAQNFVAEKIENARWTTNGPDSKFNFVCSYDPNAPPTFAPASPTPYWPTAAQSTAGFTTPPADSSPEPTPTAYGYDCLQSGSATFLFAYSTEISTIYVEQVKNVIWSSLNLYGDDYNYRVLANVRFDRGNDSVIYYHDQLQNFKASIDAHPPQHYSNGDDGSDVLDVLDKFLNNNRNPPCYSFAVILCKRYIQGNYNLTSFAQRLRHWKMKANFLTTNRFYSSGRINDLNTIAEASYGLSVIGGYQSFVNLTNLLMTVTQPQNILYSANSQYGFNVTNLKLEPLVVPSSVSNVTLAITTEAYPDIHLMSITLRIVNQATSQTTKLEYTKNDFNTGSDLIWKQIQLQSGSKNDVFMDFSTDFVGQVGIKMYTPSTLPDDWNPFGNK